MSNQYTDMGLDIQPRILYSYLRKVAMYTIKSMNALAKVLGKTVAKDSEFTFKQLKEYISVGNIKNIIQQYAEQNEYGEYSISNDDIQCVMVEIFDWLVSRELAALAAEDKVDCFWDDDKNEMVFKRKDEDFLKRYEDK